MDYKFEDKINVTYEFHFGMSESHKKHLLDPTTQDGVAAALRSAFEVIPFIGSSLGDFISALIQNQWQERATAFMKNLESKLEEIPIEKIVLVFKNPFFIALLEESIGVASRTITEERQAYILNIIINSIDTTKYEFENSRTVLKIINSLDDAEIIILGNFYMQKKKRFAEYVNIHKHILAEVNTTPPIPRKELLKNNLNKYYREHLNQLGLIVPVSKDTQVASVLGILILEQIGFINFWK